MQSLIALGPFEEEAFPLLLLSNNEAVFLFSEAFWLSTLYSVRKYALIYFLSRISKLTAQRHRSVVSFRPFTSPGPTLLSLSATCRLPLGLQPSHPRTTSSEHSQCTALSTVFKCTYLILTIALGGKYYYLISQLRKPEAWRG